MAPLIGNILNSSMTKLDHFVCDHFVCKNKGERQQQGAGKHHGSNNKEGGGDNSVTEVSLGGSDSNLDAGEHRQQQHAHSAPLSPCRTITRSPGFRRKKGVGTSDGPKFDMCIPMVHYNSPCSSPRSSPRAKAAALWGNSTKEGEKSSSSSPKRGVKPAVHYNSPCSSPRAAQPRAKAAALWGNSTKEGEKSYSSPKRGVKPAVSGLGDFLEFRKPKRQMAVINKEKFGFTDPQGDERDNSSVVSEGQRSVLSMPMLGSSSRNSIIRRQQNKGNDRSSSSSRGGNVNGVKRPSLTGSARSQSCRSMTSTTAGSSNRSMVSRGTRVVTTEELLSEYEKLLEDFNDSARVDRTGARRPSIDDSYIGIKSGSNLLTTTPSSASRRAGKRRPANLLERKDATRNLSRKDSGRNISRKDSSRNLSRKDSGRNLSSGTASAQHALTQKKSSTNNKPLSSGAAAAAAAMSRTANVSISSSGHLSAPTLRKPRPVMSRGNSGRFPGPPPFKGDMKKQPTPYHAVAPIKTKDFLGGYMDILEEFDDSARVPRSDMKGWD